MRILYRNFRRSARLLANSLGVKAFHVDRVSYHRDDDFWYGCDRDNVSAYNKFAQRVVIKEELGLPIPKMFYRGDTFDGVSSLGDEELWVVRPVRHFGGRDFRIESEPSQNPEEYSSVYFHKTREYRFLFVRGSLISIYSKLPNKTDVNLKSAWNHASGDFRFVTVSTDTYAGRKFNIAERLTESFQYWENIPDILAFDVGYAPSSWVVFEMNFAPALTDLSLSNVKRSLENA